jgi:hypothetical protein
MSKKLKAAIVAAAIALVVGFAVSYGLISPQTAEEIKAKTQEVLTDEEAAQPAPDTQPAPPTEPAPAEPAPTTETAPTEPAPQAPSPPPAEPQQVPQQQGQ